MFEVMTDLMLIAIHCLAAKYSLNMSNEYQWVCLVFFFANAGFAVRTGLCMAKAVRR